MAKFISTRKFCGFTGSGNLASDKAAHLHITGLIYRLVTLTLTPPRCAPVVSTGNRPMAAPPLVVGNCGGSVAAPPHLGGEVLWCVAKPSVPSEKLQEAINYTCGPGGANCGPIRPNGSCYMLDPVVAHVSYGFNSYWQKNKKKGGFCGFDGIVVLIISLALKNKKTAIINFFFIVLDPKKKNKKKKKVL